MRFPCPTGALVFRGGDLALGKRSLISSLVVSTTTPNVTVGTYKGSPDLIINIGHGIPLFPADAGYGARPAPGTPPSTAV